MQRGTRISYVPITACLVLCDSVGGGSPVSDLGISRQPGEHSVGVVELEIQWTSSSVKKTIFSRVCHNKLSVYLNYHSLLVADKPPGLKPTLTPLSGVTVVEPGGTAVVASQTYYRAQSVAPTIEKVLSVISA